jgi:hypothetical protein
MTDFTVTNKNDQPLFLDMITDAMDTLTLRDGRVQVDEKLIQRLGLSGKQRSDMLDIAANFDHNTSVVVSELIQGNVAKVKDLEVEWTSSYHSLVSFHLKRQPKEVRDKGFDTIYKAGQGISAWSKLLNILFSGFCRCYSRIVHQLVSKDVQLSYGASDRDISKFF